MKLINSPYTIQCQCCKKMANKLTIKDNKLVCLYCANRAFLHINSRKKHKPDEIRRLYIKFKKKNPSKKNYAINGITSVVQGGCIN